MTITAPAPLCTATLPQHRETGRALITGQRDAHVALGARWTYFAMLGGGTCSVAEVGPFLTASAAVEWASNMCGKSLHEAMEKANADGIGIEPFYAAAQVRGAIVQRYDADREETDDSWSLIVDGKAHTESHVVLVAIEVQRPARMSDAAAERALYDALPRPGTELDGDARIESWWIADDNRQDGSDNDSAVFVHPGGQAAAWRLLHAADLTGSCNEPKPNLGIFEDPRY